MRSEGSRFRKESCASAQRWPPIPGDSITARKSCSAGISPYALAPPFPDTLCAMMPASASSLRRPVHRYGGAL